MWKVTIIESERGWGQRINSVETFDTFEKAKEFQKKFNKPNDKDIAPDWYMVAMDPAVIL